MEHIVISSKSRHNFGANRRQEDMLPDYI